MNYEEFLVSVEIAEALKKIGFDEDDEKIVKLYEYKSKEIIEPTWEVHYRSSYFSYYLDHPKEFCPLFTYEQVFAWFREKGLYGNIEAGSKYNSIYIFSDNDLDMGNNIYPTYEEAREELLKRLIKIYKENI